MEATRMVRVFGQVDARNVRRDPMLRWMPVMPVVVALAVRLLFPTILERLGQLFKLDLMAYYEVIASSTLLLITPVMYGMVVGFLLLDQRDDGTLTALRVTPVSPAAYMAYRLSVPMLLGWIMTLVAFALAGVSILSPAEIALCSLSAMPLGALSALGLAAFAENKVQGFALQKVGSVLLLPPLAAYFVPAAWQPPFWLLPTYWPLKLYWSFQAGEGLWWLYLLVGITYQGLLISLLVRRFGRRAGG